MHNWQIPKGPAPELIPLCRKIAAEGAVLLENRQNILPLPPATRLAVFGRIQTTYYKSGTGSGGLVNIVKQPSIIRALRMAPDLVIDEIVADSYTQWCKENPFDNGSGWAGEPWCQKEMPLDEGMVEASAQRNDAALIIIGRSAGEDHDNANAAGSFRLTAEENRMMAVVSRYFAKVIVALNVGNLIDLSFLDEYEIAALLYIWQGGMEGADALADILTGRTAPSGKLTDTQAFSISDYPSDMNFGSPTKNIYQEDIYVGYRYFETFAKECVRYPFGFGLTYTSFSVAYEVQADADAITVYAHVRNTGSRKGREVVQLYYRAPCGKLGNPERQLGAYAKTGDLDPGEIQTLTLRLPITQMASYDDTGITGYPSCYVLEQGEYEIYAGTNVRETQRVFLYSEATDRVVKKLQRGMAPVERFARMQAKQQESDRSLCYGEVPASQIEPRRHMKDSSFTEIPYQGGRGIKLKDVYLGKSALEDFIAQLSDEDLCALACGEGPNSPKANPGAVGAFGGQTKALADFGIPVCCVADGPSGIRLDDGSKASLLPCGTLLASTWDPEAVQHLYTYVGKELQGYHIDSLLGPGINIHRHPLCGRNFEYFSEDPLLTGTMAAAVTRGIAASGCYSTIKHFCCNNQEWKRNDCEAVVSERALREIYLRGFEIAVKEGRNVLIMTSYNPVNGDWSASNYDLTTTILRNEWGYEGVVMTDWWAKCNRAGEAGTTENLEAMVWAQNDLYMVCENAQDRSRSILRGLAEGYITRGDLQRNAMNLLRLILKTPTFERYIKNGCQNKKVEISDANRKVLCTITDIKPGSTVKKTFGSETPMILEYHIHSKADKLSQNLIKTHVNNRFSISFTVNGSDEKEIIIKHRLDLLEGEHTLAFEFPECIELDSLVIKA